MDSNTVLRNAGMFLKVKKKKRNFSILYNTYITRFVSGSANNDTEQVCHNLTDNNERTHGKTRMCWQCLAPRPFSLLVMCLIVYYQAHYSQFKMSLIFPTGAPMKRGEL